MINRESALKLLYSKVKERNLIKHMLAVEAIMRALARHLGEDEELWGLVGLLHDIDYEETKKCFEKHGLVSAEILKEMLPENALNSIRAHNEMTGFKDDSKLTKALMAADQLSGLIIATALVMPNKKLSEVKVKSIKKKFKQKDFARRIRRDKIKLCEEIGVSLQEFFRIGLEALQSISSELGL